jgi:hypothetical protein
MRLISIPHLPLFRILRRSHGKSAGLESCSRGFHPPDNIAIPAIRVNRAVDARRNGPDGACPESMGKQGNRREALVKKFTRNKII